MSETTTEPTLDLTPVVDPAPTPTPQADPTPPSTLTMETVKALGVSTGLSTESIERMLPTINENKLTLDAVKNIMEAVPVSSATPPVKFEDVSGVDPAYKSGIENLLEVTNKYGLGVDAVNGLIKFDQQRTEAALKNSQKQWDEKQAEWRAELEKDSMLAADDGVEANIKKGIQVIADYGGTPDDSGLNEFQKALNVTGMGNHPALGRFLLRLAKALPGEGRFMGGSPGQAKSEQDMLAELFPNT